MNNGRKKYDHHHIVPQSRNKLLKNEPSNIVKVDRCRHSVYHTLFENELPNEIIETLVNEFWGGDWSWVRKAYEERGLCS